MGEPLLHGEALGDPLSPGPVCNDEAICRGAFETDRRHLTPEDRKLIPPPHPGFKKRIVSVSQLRKRQYSVFRDLGTREITRGEIITAISASKPTEILTDILWALVGGVRAAKGPKGVQNVRCFLVIDNVVSDSKGGKHRLHANVGYTEAYEAL